MIKIVYNKLLGGWYVVRGPHQTPLSGRFESRAQAKAWLDRGIRNRWPYTERCEQAEAGLLPRVSRRGLHPEAQ